MTASPPPAKTSRTVQNRPGILDAGARNLSTFTRPAVNRMVATFRQEKGLRYSSSSTGAFTLKMQTNNILQLVETITSGKLVVGYRTRFGPAKLILTHTMMIQAMKWSKT